MKNKNIFPDGCKGAGRILCSMNGRHKAAAFVIVPVIFLICFSMLLYGITNEKLKEKFIDIQNYLELLDLYSNFVYSDESEFVGTMLQGIQFIDGLPHVFAAMYDDTLSIIGDRLPEVGTAPFDPRLNKNFITHVSENQTGTMPIVWEDLDGGITKRIMHTCFRWITMPNSDKTFLMAAGISAYSLGSPSLNWFIGILLGVLTISLLLTFGFTIYTVKKLSYRWRYK